MLAPDATFVRSKRSYPPPSAPWSGEVAADEAEWKKVAAERKAARAAGSASVPAKTPAPEHREEKAAEALPSALGLETRRLWLALGVSAMLLAGAMLMSAMLTASALLVLLSTR